MRLISLGCFLFVFWLMLSGHYEPFLIVLGILSCAICLYMASRMRIIDSETHPVHLLARAPRYFTWLAVEIIKSAWTVTAIILSPRLPISPTVVKVAPTQKTSLGVTIFGNSITLTPGTVTVLARKDLLTVHALTKAGAADLKEGGMDRRVTVFEGEA